MARGRPNWWVILAVSLALMALLVATAGTRPHSTSRHHGLAVGATSDSHHAVSAKGTQPSATTSTTVPRGASGASGTGSVTGSNTSLASSSRSPVDAGTPTTVPPSAPSAPTTTAPAAAATTTTTAPPASSPNDRTQTPGILNPPGQRSNGFAFTGTGPTTVSVIWSGSTYLTLDVSCPSGSQSVGGTSVMQATLPDASGSCLATVSEPASESVALTYTITIGPAGG